MSIVKINVLQVPEGRGEVLEERFAARAGEVEKVDGFESFDLLRPTEGTDRYLVVTRWRDEAAFQSWLTSDAFGRGHAQSQADRTAEESGGHPGGHGGGGHPGGGPAAVGSELWGFDIVASATAASD
jgi:heme oxygenase (mycobilin-producing)